MGDDREKAPLCKGAFGAMQPGKTILDKSRASLVDCSCNQCKHWLLPLFIFRTEGKINAYRIPSGVPKKQAFYFIFDFLLYIFRFLDYNISNCLN